MIDETTRKVQLSASGKRFKEMVESLPQENQPDLLDRRPLPQDMTPREKLEDSVDRIRGVVNEMSVVNELRRSKYVDGINYSYTGTQGEMSEKKHPTEFMEETVQEHGCYMHSSDYNQTFTVICPESLEEGEGGVDW